MCVCVCECVCECVCVCVCACVCVTSVRSPKVKSSQLLSDRFDFVQYICQKLKISLSVFLNRDIHQVIDVFSLKMSFLTL